MKSIKTVLIMARDKKKNSAPQPLRVSFAFTEKHARSLELLTQDAKDVLGRSISGSAVVRALLLHADARGLQWVRENIFPIIRKEISGGRVWGRKEGFEPSMIKWRKERGM